MEENPANKKSIEFIPANCPNCGGELRVPNNRDVVKCMYCGHDVIIYDPNTITIKRKVDIDKLLAVANMALYANNFPEAYSYFTQILEEDPENHLALLGKGYAIGMMSTFTHIRINEANQYFNKVIKSIHNTDPDDVRRYVRYLVTFSKRLRQILPGLPTALEAARPSEAGRNYIVQYYEISEKRLELLLLAQIELDFFPEYKTFPNGQQIKLDVMIEIWMCLMDTSIIRRYYVMFSPEDNQYEYFKEFIA